LIEAADRPGLDRLAALMPWPRRHRHHYAGVFAPHAKLRARVTACAGQPVAETAPVTVSAADPVLPVPTRRRATGRRHHLSCGPARTLGILRWMNSTSRILWRLLFSLAPVLGALGLLLGVGMSWSHLRRRWSGQASVDRVDA
jgi:hypothetical protein